MTVRQTKKSFLKQNLCLLSVARVLDLLACTSISSNYDLTQAIAVQLMRRQKEGELDLLQDQKIRGTQLSDDVAVIQAGPSTAWECTLNDRAR